jgi:hypothetical protein
MFHKRKKMEPERREFTRYSVPPGVLHIFAHSSTTSWVIEDISVGGLAFYYTPIPGEEPEAAMIDILWNGSNACFLLAIPCRMVYDISVLPKGDSFTGTEKRRRGVQYEKLTEEQRARLKALINNRGKIPNSSE